jgi:hypothetical protein
MATEKEEYEHYLKFGQKWGWMLIIAVSVLFMGFGMFAMFTIMDPPRYWDFGAAPDTPGMSIYTTGEPGYSDNQNPPRVIAPLPEAVPWNLNRSNAPTSGTVPLPPGIGFLKSEPGRTPGASPIPGGGQ